MKPESLLMMRFKMWQLCRAISSIYNIESNSVEQDNSIDELIDQETNSEIKAQLQKSRDSTIKREQEKLKKLHERVRKIYQELKETKIGTKMLLNNKRTMEYFCPESKKVISVELSNVIEMLFSAFQLFWIIIRIGILLTVLSFGLSRLLLIFKIQTSYTVEKIGTIFFLITLLVTMAHSLINIVSLFIINKEKSFWSSLNTIIFETVFIALCFLFFCAFLKVL